MIRASLTILLTFFLWAVGVLALSAVALLMVVFFLATAIPWRWRRRSSSS